MTLSPGSKLGPYEILSPISAGGMGEVYRARDARVGRDVAIKVSNGQFSDRFSREIHAVAALNHSNIATLYDVGPNYLVMELVEGQTLAERISQGAIPLEETLVIARQIADALEAAHEKGIIHRDLKPGNIKVKPDGTVKVLDFGLAKVAETTATNTENSPTLSALQTQAGVILGTAAYMSPEQAKGKPVDKRTDIWAFGVILYEMLTGRQLFKGETVTDILAAVVTRELVLDDVPVKARRLLQACLERDPKRRLRDIGEMWRLLEPMEPSATVKRPWLSWVTGLLAVLLIAAAIPAFLYFRGREDPKTTRFHLSVPAMSNDYSLAVSPDGRRIAFVAQASGPAAPLYLCEVGSVAYRRLEGTDGASYPFWSPNSRSIGFFAKGRLKRVDVTGAPPQDICAAEFVWGGTWNRNDVILFADSPYGPLRRVPAAGGEPTPINSLDRAQKEVGHLYPYFLPDGRHYLYTVHFEAASKNGVYVGAIDSQEKVRLFPVTSNVAYAEPGYLVYEKQGNLFARPFDAHKLKLEDNAEEIRIADNIAFGGWHNGAVFSVSGDGTLIYQTGGELSKLLFSWSDRSGQRFERAGKPGTYLPYFDLSPDGKQIAANLRDNAAANWDVWLMDWTRDVLTPFTVSPGFDVYPLWSPDGLRVAFASWRKGNAELFEKKVSGTGEEMALMESPGNEWPESWSGDGRYLACRKQTGSEYDISILPFFGARKPFPIAQAPGNQTNAAFSPDGRWIAYQSSESGAYQIYLISFPTGEKKVPISNNGGVQPRWRGDGKELYYLDPDGRLMAVDIAIGSEINPRLPRVLFDTSIRVNLEWGKQYAVTRDGQRFLLLRPLHEAAYTPITIALNWHEELKLRAPRK